MVHRAFSDWNTASLPVSCPPPIPLHTSCPTRLKTQQLEKRSSLLLQRGTLLSLLCTEKDAAVFAGVLQTLPGVCPMLTMVLVEVLEPASAITPDRLSAFPVIKVEVLSHDAPVTGLCPPRGLSHRSP